MGRISVASFSKELAGCHNHNCSVASATSCVLDVLHNAHGFLLCCRLPSASSVSAVPTSQLPAQQLLAPLTLMNEFMMDMALEEIPVSGCTCFSTL